MCTCESGSLPPAVSDSGDDRIPAGVSGCLCVGAAGAREGRAAPWIHLGRTVPLGLRAAGEDEEEGVRREEEGNKGRGEVQG